MDKGRLDFLDLNSFSHHARRFIVKSIGKRKVPVTNSSGFCSTGTVFIRAH